MKKTILYLLFIFSYPICLAQTNLAIQFSKDAGIYKSSIRLALETSKDNAKIYYTIDGTQPTSASERYRKAIKVEKNTVLQAIAYADGQKSKVFTRSYFIGEQTDFALVSLAVEPAILFDETTGWMNKGPKADTASPFQGANFWSRKEVASHIEIFEPNGSLIFSDRIGVRLFGGMSRMFPQKSFAISTRTVYGDRRIKYPIFSNKDITKYKHLVLRNAGSDFPKAHFRDAFMTSLLDDVDLEKQAHRPALLFINGEYWGIYFIREKVNKFFVAHNCEVDKDSIDLIEHKISVKQGDSKHYQAMLDFMEKNDLSKKENYDYIKTQMDVENFMTYQIAQIFFDNQDAGGNIKFWRPRTADGRWRWILYDTDWGFGLQEAGAYKNNSLAFHTKPDGPAWPNPPWSTLILRNLLKNQEFEQDFITRFSDYLNTIFNPEFTTNRIDSFQRLLLPEIDRHHQKWQLSPLVWNNHIKRMKLFAKERPDYIRTFLKQKFKLDNLAILQIEKSVSGSVLLNGHINIGNKGFSGFYFQNSPIKLKAIANYGYQFSHWEGLDGVVTDAEVTVDLKNTNSIKPIFKRADHPLGGKILITELSPSHDLAGDWVELYNAEDVSVDLEGWQLSDKQKTFSFPPVQIKGKDYLVLCKDTSTFKLAFPEVFNIVGNFQFGISKKEETLQLFTPSGIQIDSMGYKLESIDSTFTLALRNLSLDNGIPTNWDVIMNTGSPNQQNTGTITTKKSYFKWLPYLIGGTLLVLVLLLFRRKLKGIPTNF